MNFLTILEELDHLYEEELKDVKVETGNTKEAKNAIKAEVAEACSKSLIEDTDSIEIVDDEGEDEEILIDDEPIIDDESPAQEEPQTETQLVLECSKCGALLIKAEADIDIDEETDLADIDDACQYCEAEEGYKVIGTFAPYTTETDETAEDDAVEESLPTEGKIKDAELDEGIFDKFKKKKTSNTPTDDDTSDQDKYPNNYWIPIVFHEKSNSWLYVQGTPPTPDKASAEKVSKEQAKNNPGADRQVITYGKAKALVGRPFRESLEDENPSSVFNEGKKEPHTIRGYKKGDPTFSSKVAKELQAKFGGEIGKLETDQGTEYIWIDKASKAKAAGKYIAKQYPDGTFSYDEQV